MPADPKQRMSIFLAALQKPTSDPGSVSSVSPGKRFPDVVNEDWELIAQSYVLPDETLREVPTELRRGQIGHASLTTG